MGWLAVVLSGVAAFLHFRTGHTLLMVIAIVAAVGCFGSWGIMHNYATELAKRRSNYAGGFYDITDREAEAVPNWLAALNMIFTMAGVVLLIIGIVFVVRK